jgi:hypothetical protein
MSKIPVIACRVREQNAKTTDGCAVEGMKLIDKFTLEPKFTLE